MALILVLVLGSGFAAAQSLSSMSDTGSQPTEADLRNGTLPDDFVKVSVLVASEGKILYSALGHACLRLECPVHNLDVVFSEEAESVQHNVLRYFAGRLNMRVVSIPTREYLQQYIDEGRGVLAYELNLPIPTKQRLWEMMDQRAADDPHPYDYVHHSCAASVFRWLQTAVGNDNFVVERWPESFDNSRYGCCEEVWPNSWNELFIGTIVQGSFLDARVPNSEKVVIPVDLIRVLQETTVYGKPLLDRDPQVLVEKSGEIRHSKPAPMPVAVCMLLLALLNLRFHWKPLRWCLAAPLWLMGTFSLYLVVGPHLPATEWSALPIPFSPIPLLFWKWRRYWAYPMAVVCALWSLTMWCWPHTLVLPVHIVLGLVMALIYLEIARQDKCKTMLRVEKKRI